MKQPIYLNTADNDVLFNAVLALATQLQLLFNRHRTNGGAIALYTDGRRKSLDLSELQYRRKERHGTEVTVKEFLSQLAAAGKEVPLKPTEIKVRLNTEYSANVRKDQVTVGCQTFPFSKIEEIIAAHKEL